jgi:hypothetical protein
MMFLSISAKKFWLFAGLVTLCAALASMFLVIGMRSFFGRSPARELATIKRNVDSSELRSWAIETLRRFPDGTEPASYSPGFPDADGHNGKITLTNGAAFLRKIPAFGAIGPEIFVSGRGPEAQHHLDLVYFYGGWGNGQSLLVGPEAFTLETNSRCIRWAQGIYYRTW